MAVVVLGLFSNNLQGIKRAILLAIGHGFTSCTLFICANPNKLSIIEDKSELINNKVFNMGKPTREAE